jgi:hypothetical protein
LGVGRVSWLVFPRVLHDHIWLGNRKGIPLRYCSCAPLTSGSSQRGNRYSSDRASYFHPSRELVVRKYRRASGDIDPSWYLVFTALVTAPKIPTTYVCAIHIPPGRGFRHVCMAFTQKRRLWHGYPGLADRPVPRRQSNVCGSCTAIPLPTVDIYASRTVTWPPRGEEIAGPLYRKPRPASLKI